MKADSSNPPQPGDPDTETGENPETVALEEILAAFQTDPLQPAKVSVFYKLALVLVAVMMGILPLVYLGLIGGVGYWVYLAFTLDSVELYRRFDIESEGLVFFSGVLGIIAIFFLVKPILARRGKPPAPLLIEPGEEPKLEAFVHRIADSVGASRPRQIEVDCNVNAAAGFRRGFWSLFTNDLKLIIGLPLAGGMNLRSFGGVLAHEFGHFGQGTGMRLTYLIRTINAWFARVVYERDAWDERLARWSRGGDFRIMIFLMATRLFIWVSRRVLWLLMHAGHAISCFAMRQMEYDADSYEIQFAGSAVFPETSRNLQLLGVGANRAHQLLGDSWEHKQLARNLPQLGLVQTRSIPKEVHEAIDAAVKKGKTGIFDSHPSDSDRIAAAKRSNCPGVFHLTVPASVLFNDFETWSEKATRHYYNVTLELPVQDENLVDNALIEGNDSARQESFEALDRFFFEGVSLKHPLFVTPADLQMAPDITENDLIRLRGELEAESQSRTGAIKSLNLMADRLDDMLRGRELLEAGFKIKPAEFGLKRSNVGDAVKAEHKIRTHIAELVAEMEAFDNLARRRLIAGLDFRRLAEPGDTEVQGLAAVLELFQEIFPVLGELRDLLVRQSVLLQNLSAENSEDHISRMRANGSQMIGRVKKVQARLAGHAYPFEHPKGQIKLDELVASEWEEQADPVFNHFNATDKCVNQLFPLYFRILGRLAMLADEMTPGPGVAENHDEAGGEDAVLPPAQLS